MMSSHVQILVTGDTNLGSGRVRELALGDSRDQLFREFKTLIENADLSITNLETPLVENAEPIQKTGPNLKSPVPSLKVLKEAGFDLVTLANNHIMDFGEEGLVSTLKACAALGMDTVGAGLNLDNSRQPFECEIKGIRIAVINIAENEFGTTNGDEPGAHALNPVQNYYRIREIRDQTDFLLLVVHGGHENYTLPSPRMKETYRFFVDAGVDAVVGHHTHCYSGYEIYKGAPIFYSVGNLLFDNPGTLRSAWNEGFMVEFSLGNSGLNFQIIPYIQNENLPGLHRLKKEEHSQFQKNLSQLNEIIDNSKRLELKFNEYCKSKRNLYNNYIEPHSIKYIHTLQNRNLLPSLLSDRKKRLLLNLTRCEAHRDVLKKILEQ